MRGDPTFTTAQYEDQLGEDLDFRGIRLPALALDQMLGAAAVFAQKPDAEFPSPMEGVHLTVDAATLTVTACDGRAVVRERRVVNQSSDGSTFLLQVSDLRTLRSVLRAALSDAAKEDKPVLPVDVLLGDTGFMEAIIGERRVMCSPLETPVDHPFPDLTPMYTRAAEAVDRGLEPLDVALNADLLAKLRPLQKSGYGVFRFRRGKRAKDSLESTVLCTPLNQHSEFDAYERTAEVLIMPVRANVDPDAVPKPKLTAGAEMLRHGKGLHIAPAPEDES